jgi:peroxiredoxin
MIETDIMDKMVTNTGKSLSAFSKEQPILLIFLRRFGCTFCREALADISKTRPSIEKAGTKVIFVHMADTETAEAYFKRFKLPKAIHISDPDCFYYHAFGLFKGNLRQLFSLNVMIRGFKLALQDGYGFGFLGDGFQMPGIFLIQNGKVVNSYIHDTPADKPDYFGIAGCCVTDS